MKLKIVILLCSLAFTACQSRNKLNSDEQKLAAQITSDENEKQVAEAALKQNVSAIPDSLPLGFRFHEDRSVDPMNPPKHLDILGTQENTRNFKLSDVASSIKYIKLETPSDSTLFWTHPKLGRRSFDIFSDDNHIFVQGLFGLAQFDMNGKYQKLIWKNETGSKGLSWKSTEFYGITNFDQSSIFKDNLYLRFTDGKNRQVQIVKKEIQNELVLNNPVAKQEGQRDTLIANKLLTLREKYISRRYPKVFGISEDSWVGVHDKWYSANTGDIFVLFNNSGDTLCTFSSSNKVDNFSKTLVRAASPFTYYYNDQLTFLEQYSDTIFRLIPPNRFVPIYIVDFGINKVGFLEGLYPDSDLSQKLMLHSINETRRYLFIRYTKNSVSPRNLKSKSVTFYNAIFNKNEGKLYHFPKHSAEPKNLINDIDGGISFWPEFITPEGKMLMMVSGRMMKEYVNSNDFASNTMSEEQRQKQIGMANALVDSDKLVVMVN